MNQPVLRTDILTRERYLKKDLFRLVVQNGFLVLDIAQNLPGRGVYVSKTPRSIELLRSGKVLAKKHLPPLQGGVLKQMEEFINE